MSRRGGRNKQNGKSAHGRPRNGQRDTSRLSRSTPIREVVREGQEVIVQISKEPIGTKGARVTSHISLPGRYVVYLPTVDHDRHLQAHRLRQGARAPARGDRGA